MLQSYKQSSAQQSSRWHLSVCPPFLWPGLSLATKIRLSGIIFCLQSLPSPDCLALPLECSYYSYWPGKCFWDVSYFNCFLSELLTNSLLHNITYIFLWSHGDPTLQPVPMFFSLKCDCIPVLFTWHYEVVCVRYQWNQGWGEVETTRGRSHGHFIFKKWFHAPYTPQCLLRSSEKLTPRWDYMCFIGGNAWKGSGKKHEPLTGVEVWYLRKEGREEGWLGRHRAALRNF